MKLIAKTLLPAAATLILAVLPCVLPCEAQPQITPADEFPASALATDRKTVHQIRLKFVKPSLMAHWLDPANHERPRDAATAELSADALRLNFPLPGGIDRIVPIDPQNSLLVFGTDEGAQRLREIVEVLDKLARPGPVPAPRPIPRQIPPRGFVLPELRAVPRAGELLITARLVTLPSVKLDGVYADLAARSQRNAASFSVLSPAAGLDLDERARRGEAKIETFRLLSIAPGATGLLDFGASTAGSPRNFQPRGDLFEDFFVIPPPPGFAMRMPPILEPRGLPAPLPAPLAGIRIEITPEIQPDDVIALTLKPFGGSEVLGAAPSLLATVTTAETLICALPNAFSTPGNRTFLLISARPGVIYRLPQRLPRRAPDLRKLPPPTGDLFRTPRTPTPQMPLPFGELFRVPRTPTPNLDALPLPFGEGFRARKAPGVTP